MKFWFFSVVTTVAMMAWAQTGPSSRPAATAGTQPTTTMSSGQAEQFMVPEYDENGVLKWRMFGNNARLELTGGKVEVHVMKLEMFHNSNVNVTVTSPVCMFDRTAKTATSEEAVKIVATNMVVTGTGFDWSAADNLMRIHNDVTVTIANRKAMDFPRLGPRR